MHRVWRAITDPAEPQRLFSLRWDPCAIEKLASGVMLSVTESGFDQNPLARGTQVFHANEQGWSVQVKLIEAYLVRTP